MAYSIRSRAGVTAAIRKMAVDLKQPFDFEVVESLSDEEFWRKVQSVVDKVVDVSGKIAMEVLCSTPIS